MYKILYYTITIVNYIDKIIIAEKERHVKTLKKEKFMTLGERIKKLREDLNMSQVELAEAVGVTKQAIFSCEKGINIPNAIVLAHIADALKCTTDYLLGRG